MTTLKFTIARLPNGAVLDDFLGAVDDATDSNALIGINEHNGTGDIDLETDTPLKDAITLLQIARDFEIAVTSVDELLTAAEIAERAGRSRASISLLAKGERGPGTFPLPINPGARHELYRWVQVSAWLKEAAGPEADAVAFLDTFVRLSAQSLVMSEEAKILLTTKIVGKPTLTPFSVAIESVLQTFAAGSPELTVESLLRHTEKNAKARLR